jgi:formamidopyrimidine-DNA glycosylase
LEQISVTHPRTARRNASPEEVEARLRGRRVESVGRKGKFLLVALDDGYILVAHLGMSGRFAVADPAEERPAHTHFVATLDDGNEVRFIDPRTFGFVAVFDEDERGDTGLARLGPDAWDALPDAAALRHSLRTRRAPIKALLLDQVVLAGLGNIYADEALHQARIHPLTPGGDLDGDNLEALLAAVTRVLAAAIESGGTTLGDLAYLLPDGRAGENLGRLAVYGREGEPCPSCGTPIQRLVVRARSTHFCPRCQAP